MALDCICKVSLSIAAQSCLERLKSPSKPMNGIDMHNNDTSKYMVSATPVLVPLATAIMKVHVSAKSLDIVISSPLQVTGSICPLLNNLFYEF